MAHDDSGNPFRALAQELAKRGKNSATARPEKKASLAGKTPRQDAAEPLFSDADTADTANTTDSADAALFLNTVSRIKTLHKKTQKTHRGTGQTLAERMKGKAPASRAEKSAPSHTNPAPHAAQQPSAAPKAHGDFALADADQASFDHVMHGLFAGPETKAANTPQPDPEDDALFAKAMAGAAPLGGKGRDLAPATETKNAPPALDPHKVLQEILEGRVEFALHHTDEYMEGFVVGVDPLVLARLRAGRYSPEKHIDLHGLNARQAHDALTFFIKDAYQRSLRCVVVVTGRGRNSPDGIGVLRPLLQEWLTRDPFKRVVLAFCTARPNDGGPGAVYVLLRKYKKSRGKIVWERTPANDDFPDI